MAIVCISLYLANSCQRCRLMEVLSLLMLILSFVNASAIMGFTEALMREIPTASE